MEKLKFNPSNKKYYSEDFIKGFECGVERQFEKYKAEIKELSYELKGINRSIMDENTLIGFNMAVALFNKCFGEIGALKNEQSEQNVGMCQQNVGEMSEKHTDGDLISREDALKCFNVRELKFKDKKDAELMKHYLELSFNNLEKLPSVENTDRVITELEKITESIKEIKGDNKYVVSDYMCGAYEAFDVVFDIIKDRIAELKGDKKWESVKY